MADTTPDKSAQRISQMIQIAYEPSDLVEALYRAEKARVFAEIKVTETQSLITTFNYLYEHYAEKQKVGFQRSLWKDHSELVKEIFQKFFNSQDNHSSTSVAGQTYRALCRYLNYLPENAVASAPDFSNDDC